MGYLDSPGVSDGSKDIGPVLVAWWLIPPNPTDLVVEPGRQSFGSGLGGASVDEHEFESFVRTHLGEVLEYQFDCSGLGRRCGDHSHAEWQSRDVDTDDALRSVGSTVGAALVMEGGTPVRCPAGEVRIDDHHRG